MNITVRGLDDEVDDELVEIDVQLMLLEVVLYDEIDELDYIDMVDEVEVREMREMVLQLIDDEQVDMQLQIIDEVDDELIEVNVLIDTLDVNEWLKYVIKLIEVVDTLKLRDDNVVIFVTDIAYIGLHLVEHFKLLDKIKKV